MAVLETLDSVDRWVRTIYQVTGSPARWERLLAQLCGNFDALSSAVVHQDLFADNAKVRFSAGLAPAAANDYAERFAAKNPWLVDRDRYRPGLAWTGCESVPHSHLVELDFYKEYLAPMDAFHRLCGTLVRTESEIVYVTFYRARRAPCFAAPETQFLARLLPHLAQALALHETLLRERAWREIYLHSIDRLAVAVFLVDSLGTLLMANRKGEALLGEPCGVCLSNRCLTATKQADARQLRRVLARLSSAPNDRFAHVAVTREVGCHPLMLSISPVGGETGSGPDEADALALITTRDPDHVAALGPCQFGEAYGLTCAEDRLSRLILEGHSLIDAAARLRVSLNTARSHMKSVYAKTGTHRQADLIHLHARTCTDHF